MAAFITCIGPKAIYNGIPFENDEEKKSLDKILELWESYFLGKTNITYERYHFNNRDRIVCGVRDSGLRKKLLQVQDLMLEKCIDMCRSAEATSSQMEATAARNSNATPPSEVKSVERP